MHLCSAYIALGGDTNNVVYRGPDNPVSWPEIGVIQFIHGEEAVYNIELVDEREVSRSAEKQRLADLYGVVNVEHLYPGRSPVMEMEMPGVAPKNKRKAKGSVIVQNVVEEEPGLADTEE